MRANQRNQRQATVRTTEQTFTSWDGTKLFYRAWQPAKPTDKALLLFHRGHEHSARWQETMAALGLEDVAVFAWDARGHGHSPGERGSAENLGVIIRDVEAFVRHVAAQHQIPIENMVVLAHSVGAVTVAAWVHDYAPPIRGLILGVPAFRVKLYVPFAVPLLRLKQKLFGHGYVKSYVKAKMLTHDPEQAAAYKADPMIFRQIAVNILLDLHDTSTRLMADAAAITTPTLLFVADADWVVKKSAQETFFDRLSSPVKRLERLPGFYHAIFHERERRLVVSKAREFILECFHQTPRRDSLLAADRHGFTRDEFDRLCGPGNPLFGLVRFGLKTVGRLSRGIQLGWESGFDSGRTLDYVYENRPQGATPVGRAIDRSYLNSIGWRGIRERKVNLQKILHATIEKVRAQGKPVNLLDIASGPGRYVLETVKELPGIPTAVQLRDYKPENVDAARHLAVELELKNVTVTQGDAFNRASLAAVTPKPNIAIVSGLFELYPSNEPVLNSLRGLADGVEAGGYLIYTNQPWHPQVEFIARVLTNREGKPWIMRRRTQAEMDELVHAAGFEKIRQESDQWGIFTVSLARRMK
ncbi:MAG TPA: bifunctional alpha/beta hydrolase/class I SAM-dependent methyltransferase [Verrucomicrobiae bacterium]|nr:bifunctional alpha/beta hydrolase/class I SAM-dependent methyltransferase [Verrucomicrobiae bacterium]